MLLPLTLLFLATLSAAILAYGTHPAWADFAGGLPVILLTRRLEWVLAAIAILLAVAVIGLIVAGKRRAWWLIGLGPILALFVHRYQTDPLRKFAVLDQPPFVPAAQVDFLADSDYVVGLVFEGTAYACPYHALYPAPVIVLADHDKRMLLIWNAFANRAIASHIARDLRAADLEIVSMPRHALLLYNRKLGQFINGLTGLTPQSRKPTLFQSPIATQKMPWGQWLARHPQTLVMRPPPNALPGKLPNAPLRPKALAPVAGSPWPPETIVHLLATQPPVAVVAQNVTEAPANTTIGDAPILIFRETQTNRLRVFDRRVEDLAPRFRLNTNPRRKNVLLVDVDTNSGWSADGRAIDGPLGKESKRLTPIAADELLWWGVIKQWMPDLQLLDLTTQP